VSHPLEVASILAAHKLDTSSIITGLLHDTVEDTGATLDQIAARFGEDVAQLVDGVTKLTKLEMRKALASSGRGDGTPSREERDAENLRKLVRDQPCIATAPPRNASQPHATAQLLSIACPHHRWASTPCDVLCRLYSHNCLYLLHCLYLRHCLYLLDCLY
jgi:hypothetical protein